MGAACYIHGGGQWHDCLYLLDAGVVCQVVWEADFPALGDVPRAHAYRRSRAAFDAELAHQPKSPEGQRPVEEIRIDAALVRAIVDLADLSEQQRVSGERLARECLVARAVGDKDSLRPRDF